MSARTTITCIWGIMGHLVPERNSNPRRNRPKQWHKIWHKNSVKMSRTDRRSPAERSGCSSSGGVVRTTASACATASGSAADRFGWGIIIAATAHTQAMHHALRNMGGKLSFNHTKYTPWKMQIKKKQITDVHATNMLWREEIKTAALSKYKHTCGETNETSCRTRKYRAYQEAARGLLGWWTQQLPSTTLSRCAVGTRTASWGR